jgi:hypothetical protein
VIIERDKDGYYVGKVPQLRVCYSQGKTLAELMTNIEEVIELVLKKGMRKNPCWSLSAFRKWLFDGKAARVESQRTGTCLNLKSEI